MNSYLEKWFRDLCSRRGLTPKREITVVGTRNAHRGARWEYAEVEFRIRPASELMVSADHLASKGPINTEYINAAIYGLLDILLAHGSAPISAVVIEVLAAREHEVDSSAAAFREAGRDAGRKVLEALNQQLFEPPSTGAG